MANITSVNDFIGQNNIPDKATYGENLQWFIDKYEPILLKKLLEDDLYTLFIATPTDARFVALLPFLKPACVDYIYWFYLQDQAQNFTSLGGSQSKKQNAITVSVYPKMVRAWNEMVNYNRELHKYLVKNDTVYPEYVNHFPAWFFYWYGIDWFWGDWREGCDIDEVYKFQNTLGV